MGRLCRPGWEFLWRSSVIKNKSKFIRSDYPILAFVSGRIEQILVGIKFRFEYHWLTLIAFANIGMFAQRCSLFSILFSFPNYSPVNHCDVACCHEGSKRIKRQINRNSWGQNQSLLSGAGCRRRWCPAITLSGLTAGKIIGRSGRRNPLNRTRCQWKHRHLQP